MERKELTNLERKVENIERELKSLTERDRPSKLTFNDLVQELVGALVVALPAALSEEIWELSQKLSPIHIFGIYLFVLVLVNIFVRYGNQKQWEKQSLLGFIQLRLLTSALLSLLVSAVTVALLGVYPNFVEGWDNYLKVVLFVSSFAVLGSLGLDMAR